VILMPAVKVLARNWVLEVATGKDATTGSLIYTEVKGINSLTFSSSKNDAETTTFDDDGWETHLVASRGRSLSVEGYYLVDPADGTRDPGQLEVEELNDKIGPESLGDFRLTNPAGKKKTFKASVNLGDIGGGNDDPTSWGAELNVSGQPVAVA
jgi:hypothetical protein